MSSANLRLRLFGTPVVTGADGAPVGGLEPQRLALLALLALHPKRTVSRDALTGYLWPTRSVEQARQALNQAVFGISKALGDDAIFSSAKEVRLGSQVSVDALEFQSALEAGRPDDAMPLYTAPLMDGFELDDAQEFQQWATSQRARFATAARTRRAVPDSAVEVSHDLAEPDKPDSGPPKPRKDKPEKKARKEPEPPKKPEPPKEREPPSDFVLLAEPVVEARVERASEGPELRAKAPAAPDLLPDLAPVDEEPAVNAAPAEPGLLTNAVPSEPEPVPSVAPPVSREPASVAPPPSPPPPPLPPEPPPPPEDVQWIAPDAPAPSFTLVTTGALAPPPATPTSQETVPPAVGPSRAIESKPPEQQERRVKRPRRPFPRPSRRLVITVVVLVALGALGYMARGWMAAARGGVEVAREGIAAARARADAVLQAGERKRSIAVLPLEYSGRNRADTALARRIVEELGPMLTRAGLLVMPSAALTRGGPPYDLRRIADSLKVDHILQGVMQREGTGLAFRFRLVNPFDGTTRWEETYRPKMADIPVLQEDVAATVGTRILREK